MTDLPQLKIETTDNVRTYFKHLLTVESVAFHPDTPFDDYINHETKQPTYTPREALRRDQLMNQCFKVCHPFGEDYIYLVACEVDPVFQ